jgi:hypothetical protein
MNEAVFRTINERIEELHHRFALADAEPLEILCECDRATCASKLTVPIGVYERVRADSARFFVCHGHEDPAVEDIVDSGGEYLVVRKHSGEPRRIAEQTDPRA